MSTGAAWLRGSSFAASPGFQSQVTSAQTKHPGWYVDLGVSGGGHPGEERAVAIPERLGRRAVAERPERQQQLRHRQHRRRPCSPRNGLGRRLPHDGGGRSGPEPCCWPSSFQRWSAAGGSKMHSVVIAFGEPASGSRAGQPRNSGPELSIIRGNAPICTHRHTSDRDSNNASAWVLCMSWYELV